MSVNLIVALGKNKEIGINGDLIWKIPEDLKEFKKLTLGHPVIMGRKTWESLPKKPLPGRRNIVITRQKDFNPEGAETVNSVEEALSVTKEEDPFIIGGASIYEAFLPYVTKLYITSIEASCGEADTYLNIDLSDWDITDSSDTKLSPEGIAYRFLTLSPSNKI